MKTGSYLDRSTLILGAVSGAIYIGFFDPVNWPKQIALMTALPFLIFLNTKRISRGIEKGDSFNRFIFQISISLILLASLYSWVFLKLDFNRILFGVWGRNNGLLTLLCLVSIMYLFCKKSRDSGIEVSVLRSIEAVSILYAIYGSLQVIGKDPIRWASSNQIFAFFGNTNFASAIFALSAISSLALLLFTSATRTIVSIRITLILAFVTLSYLTSSIQGITAISIAITLFLFLKYAPRSFRARFSVLVALSSLGVFVFLSFLGIGPLGSQLEQYTLKLRFEYWLAGIKMGLTSPIFGLGVDSYGDSYRLFRSLDVTRLTSVDLQTNNAHNVFIQIFATLGLVGLFAILIPFILGAFASIKILMDTSSSNEKKMTVVVFLALWSIAFFSIDNIGIAVWNYLFLGLALGYFTTDTELGEKLARKFARDSSTKTKFRLGYDASRLATWLAAAIIFTFCWYASLPDRELQRIVSIPPSSNVTEPIQGRIDEIDRALSNPFVSETQYWYYASELNKAKVNVDHLIVTIDNALDKYPKDFGLLDVAAGVREQSNIFAAAIPFRERLIAREGRHPRVWLSYAFDLKSVGRGTEAVNAFKKALEFKEFLGEDILSQLPELAREFGVPYPD